MATISAESHRPHCVRCLREADCLYRKFSPTSLKLTVCESCGYDVDYYVEREVFLVAMDVVLLRQDAYRHLLLNRIQDFDVQKNWRKAIQYVLASGVLQTYLLWEAYPGGNESHRAPGESLRDLLDRQDKITISLLLHLFPLAIARLLTPWIVFYWCLRRFSRRATHPRTLFTRSYLAVMFPTSFAVVTILVLVWENTYTVRLLGSLLVLVYQVLSIYTVSSAEGLGPKESTVAIVFAVACNALISRILSVAGGQNGMSCTSLICSIHPDLYLCLS